MASIEFDPVIGYAAALALLAIGVVLLIAGRKRGNDLRPVWVAAILAVIGTQAAAADRLDFSVFGVAKSTNTTSPASSDPQLDFACFGLDSPVTAENECHLNFGVFGCKCGPDCDCRDCDCGCSKKVTRTLSIEEEDEPEHRQNYFEVWTLPKCAPCEADQKDYRTWLERSGYEVSPAPTAHFRLMDIELHPELARHRGIEYAPTYVLISGGKEVLRYSAYLVRDTDGKERIERVYPGRERLVKDLVSAINKWNESKAAILNEKPRVVRAK